MQPDPDESRKLFEKMWKEREEEKLACSQSEKTLRTDYNEYHPSKIEQRPIMKAQSLPNLRNFTRTLFTIPDEDEVVTIVRPERKEGGS